MWQTANTAIKSIAHSELSKPSLMLHQPTPEIKNIYWTRTRLN